MCAHTRITVELKCIHHTEIKHVGLQQCTAHQPCVAHEAVLEACDKICEKFSFNFCRINKQKRVTETMLYIIVREMLRLRKALLQWASCGLSEKENAKTYQISS